MSGDMASSSPRSDSAGGSVQPEYLRVAGRYAQLLRGELKVEDLDDEELARGRLRDKNGGWSGRPPRAVPQEMVQAMRREWLGRAEEKLRAALHEHGIGTLVELASNTQVDSAVRLRAAQLILERTMGKVPDKVTVAAEDPVQTLFNAILSDPQGLTPALHEPHKDELKELI